MIIIIYGVKIRTQHQDFCGMQRCVLQTFSTYQLVKKLKFESSGCYFKPAVEDALQADLENHIDFEGWQYLSRANDEDPTKIKGSNPFVYFGSFQDLLVAYQWKY